LAAQEKAKKKRMPLVTYLVSQKKVAPIDLAMLASAEFGIPVFNLPRSIPNFLPKSLVDETLIRQHWALPIGRHDNRLFVAIAEPMNQAALDESSPTTGSVSRCWSRMKSSPKCSIQHWPKPMRWR
jgi:type IV pilus assembly protein PilB